MLKFLVLSLILKGFEVLSEEETLIPGDENFKFATAAQVNKTSTNDGAKNIVISDVLIVIRSQHYKYHRQKAEDLKRDLVKQAKAISSKASLDVLMIHESWAPYGSWTILPIINKLATEYITSKKWIFFCEDTTEINLKKLLDVLSGYDHDEEKFLGHALTDTEPAIIHHFAFFEDISVFSFPDFAAGWAISKPLCQWLDKKLQRDRPSMDFSIDIQHEVATYIYNKNEGFNLTNVEDFCINKNLRNSKCATTVNKVSPNCGIVPAEDIFIGVKTCEKFHKDRLPFVLKTVGKDAKHIVYYSDKQDSSIPTEYIGVANTETGHCTKLYNIIERAYQSKYYKTKPWVVIIDDDTIINFSRLQKILACYDSSEPILLGERYGYGINFQSYGYEYITGGGGMILSRNGVEKLMNSNCRCASDNSPDDMWLGMCFRTMGFPSIHSSSFHQARPSQYVPELLQHQYIVSFHKHFMIDPMDVYKKYLLDNSTTAN